MNSDMQSILQSSGIMKKLSPEDAMLLFSFLASGTRESLEADLTEKVHDQKCTEEKKQALLSQFDAISLKFSSAFVNYTNTVNAAYDESFYDILQAECERQESVLKDLETQYHSLLSKNS